MFPNREILTEWLRQLDLFGKNQGRDKFDLELTLAHIRHVLPNQGPIKEFIAQNTLRGFQSLPFHEGLRLAGKLFGAKSYLDLEFYEAQFQAGKITETHLDFVLGAAIPDPEVRNATKQQLLSFKKTKEVRPPNVALWGLRRYWYEKHQLDLTALVSPVICKLTSNYLDQGISFWPIPCRKDSFWSALKELTQNSFCPVLPFSNEKFKLLLAHPAEKVLEVCLEKLVGNPEFYSRYLLETALCYSGWSTMICALEVNPGALRKPCSISLLDFLSVVLTLETLFLEKHLSHAFHVPNFVFYLEKKSTDTQETISLERFWHESYEWSFYDQLLRGLHYQTEIPAHKTTHSWAQAIFCIDDRECSVRRHLETLEPGIETFGTAGFFGVDFWFLGHDEVYPIKQSPLTLEPKHLVRATPKAHVSNKKRSDGLLDVVFGDFISDLFLVPFLSVNAVSQLIKSIFLSKNTAATASSLNQFDSQVMLEFEASKEESKDARFRLGFTVEEMAERVAQTLKAIGLTKNFAPCVYVVAHGGSSANNPHFAAYDCGACSGKSGAPNSRAFAWMANYTPVREKLKERGIDIPQQSLFYSVLHDTTQDKALFFNEDLENRKSTEGHLRFQKAFEKTLMLNAKERARRLDLIPTHLSLEKNAELMAQRAHSIFEPRPELTHTNNATAIVGRRDLTRGLFLDRRAFLQSYDPNSDPKGSILEGILGAVIPVCGGINLQYFFSRIDNEKYGAGTKLSHNVVGMIGVTNGVNTDLINGLPSQMIELHEPLRLLLVVEQEPELILSVLRKNSGLYQWIENHWVRLVAISPKTKSFSLWNWTNWMTLPMATTESIPSLSMDILKIGQIRETIPVSIINPPSQTEITI